MIESAAVLLAEGTQLEAGDEIGLDSGDPLLVILEKLPVRGNGAVAPAQLAVAGRKALESSSPKLRVGGLREPKVDGDGVGECAAHLFGILGSGESDFGRLHGPARVWCIGDAIAGEDAEIRCGFDRDAGGSELSPVHEVLVDGVGAEFGGAPEPVLDLLCGRGPVLVNGAHPEREKDEPRYNYRNPKTPQHISILMPRR